MAALLLVAVLAERAMGDEVSFSSDIAPILLENCQSCHGPKKVEGGYRVDTFEAAAGEGDSGLLGFLAADLEESEAFRRIISNDESERMPLDSDPLSKEQTELLKRWIEQGAKFDGQDPKIDLVTLVARAAQPDPPEKYPHPLPLTAMQFSHDGQHLFVGGYHEVTVWSVGDGKLLRRITNIGQRTLALDLSPDGKVLAVAGGAPGRNGSIRTIDVATGELRSVLGLSGDLVMDVRFSPDGKHIAAGNVARELLVFDAESGETVHTISRHSDWVNAVAWSPDGTKLVTGSRDKFCKVFDAKTGELTYSYNHGQPVKGITFLPNGTEVFSSGSDNKVQRWQIANGKKAAEFVFGDEVFKLPALTESLFAVSADKTVRQIDPKENKEVRQFLGHEDWPLSVDVHAGTKRLATGDYRGEVRIWNTEDGAPVVTFTAAPGYSRQLSAK